VNRPSHQRCPAFFHEAQLEFKPRYEWAFGEKITHPETTARAESILAALQGVPDLFVIHEPKEIPLSALRALHSYQLLTLYTAAEQLEDDQDFHPTVFPKLKRGQGDPTNLQHAGAYCFDSGTPLNAQTMTAASWSAACAREAARAVRRSETRLAYALSRPPGHHVERDLFGGYCYFNNPAIAVRELKRGHRIAVIDIDFHHGNGTQSLFYRDPAVLVVSLHGDPREHFPFFSGFATETGLGDGDGFNVNIVLPDNTDGPAYLAAMNAYALPAVRMFDPEFIVVAAGLDAYERDPIGAFKLTTEDFTRVGELIGGLGRPIAAVQEGGYYTSHLGRNAVALLRGLRAGLGLEV
jgi:acetoin utilization deacetylase AcuC-like enzyme